MSLTSEQMNNIVVDMLNGAKPRETGKEADVFRKEMEPEITLAKKKGWTVHIPSEWVAPEKD